jgi:ABC-type Fe3+/spermidine/putrescine transport system ATPase subunit
MQFEIKRIQHALGLTVIYVTHDQEEALSLSDRIAIMNDGNIHQVGTPDEIYEHPATAFVAEFVGESNFLDGVVEAKTTAGTSIQSSALGCSILGPTTTAQPDAAVRLMIRPEAIDVCAEAAPLQDNVLAGVVVEMVYLGQTVRYLVQTSGALLTVRSPHRPGARIFQQDEPVKLTWSRASTLILP